MKVRNFVLTLVSVFALFCLVSCGDFAIPQKIQVKTDAEVKANIGSFDASSYISDYLSPTAFRTTIQSTVGDTAKVYDFVPTTGDDTLTYLVYYPLFSTDFNVSELIGDNFDLSDAMGGVDDMVQTLEMPSFDPISETQTINAADFLTLPTTALGSESTTAYEYTTSPGTVDITASFEYAEGIKYKSGSKFIITVTRTDSNSLGSDYKLEMQASIASSSFEAGGETRTYNGSTSSEVYVQDGGTLELSISNGVMPKEVTLHLDVTPTGTAATAHEYTVSVAFSSGSAIQALYGVDATKFTSLATQSISQSMDLSGAASLLKTATIASGGGSISIVAEKPTGWDAFNLTMDSFTLSGAMSVTSDDFTDDGSKLINEVCDLAGKTIDLTSSTSIDVAGSITPSVTDGGNIDFSSSTSVTIAVNFAITKFSEATVDTSSVFSGIDTSFTLPTEVTTMISSISFGSDYDGDTSTYEKKTGDSTYETCEGIGIKFEYVNSLPTGSDIPLKMTSEKLGITSDSSTDNGYLTLTASGKTTAVSASILSHPTLTFDGNEYTVAINVGIGDSGVITLKDITLGSSYTFGIKDVEFVCDWDSAAISGTALESFSKNDTVTLDFDIQSMIDSLNLGIELSNFEFGSIPVYLYAIKPSGGDLATLFEDVSIKGKAYINYTNSSGTDATFEIIGTTSTDETVEFKDPIDWPSDTSVQVNPKNNAAFISSLTENASVTKDLAEIVNAAPQKVTSIVYDAGVECDSNDGLTLYSYQLSSSDSTKIALECAFEIPLKFRVKEDVQIDIANMLSNLGVNYDAGTTDILGRTSKDDYAAYKDLYDQYGACLEYVKIGYKLTNNVVKNLDGTLIIDDTVDGHKAADSEYTAPDDGPTGIEKEFSLAKSNNFTLTNEDVQTALFEKYPFSPEIYVTLPETVDESNNDAWMYLSRSGMASSNALKVELDFAIKLTDDTPIEFNISDLGFNTNGGE